MTLRQPALVLAVLVTSACAASPRATPAPAPAPAPAPVHDGVAGDAMGGAATSTAPRGDGPATSGPVMQAGAPAGGPGPAGSVAVTPADVEVRARGIFGAMPEAPATAAPVSAGSAEPAEPSWDMEVTAYETQERVGHYVRYFSGPARDRITQRLEIGSRYEPMIREKMREGGLPEDMYYLALVESGFDPNAYSRAAAVGMWQFMTSTGRDMGLRVDWWVDERRDPVKSTAAAVRFIRGLRDQFGSLYLAAAAYNGGPGRIARGLSRYADDMQGAESEDRFFVLAEKDYLKNETKEYVPQLIAAALVAKDPARYGMTITPREPLAYDSVRVPALTPLAAIAKGAGTSLATIQELNPQVLRGMTPPGAPLTVRIPAGRAERFDAAMDELGREERVGAHKVETRKGLSLEKIAEDAGIRVRDLERYNPQLRRTKKGRVIPGQVLLVPTAATVKGAASVPDPSIERYGSAKKGKVVFHVVKKGETLGHIAKRYHTSVAALLRMNGMKKQVIFPGQELVVAGGKAGKGAVRKGGTAKRATAKRATAKRATAKGAAAKRAAAKGAPAKKHVAKKVAPKKAPKKKAKR